ncbi:MAG: tail fiber domain-containing protein [Bacteroidales bacterium]|nr:tail fiber domain-containing protein [Bacteroidales bacterium]
MRPLFLSFLAIAICAVHSVFAQAPQELNYQAVVRDASGNPIASTTVGVKLSILQGSSSGSPVCIEEFSPATNAYGLVTLEIGSVNNVDFEAIDWSVGPYFLKVEIEQAGGTSYTEAGTTQLLSVPYALHAATAEKTLGDSLWRQSGANIYYNDGKIGIGTGTPVAKLSILNEDLQTAAGSRTDWMRLNANTGNTDNLYIYHNRHTDGTDWNSSEIRIQKQVDATPMHYISYKGLSDNNANLEIGFNNSPYFAMDKFGRVGISTTNPGALLHVNYSSNRSLAVGGWFDASSVSGGIGAAASNAYLKQGDNTFRFSRDHASIGASGIAFNKPYWTAVGIFANSGATTADQEFTPNWIATFVSSGKVGIGTTTPSSRLEVEGNSAWPDEDPLFEVKNKDGTPVFAVYNNGVRVLIEDDPAKKGPKGGFAIGGFDRTKAGSTVEFMRITPDSIRFNINNAPATKGPKGGFAIGGFDRTKGIIEDFMSLSPEGSSFGSYNTFIGFRTGTNNTFGFYNTYLGRNAGYSNSGGVSNVFIGDEAGYNSDGSWSIFPTVYEGSRNVIIGPKSGYYNKGNANVFIGLESGYKNTTGGANIFIGNNSGYDMKTGQNNIFIGLSGGRNNESGSNNIFIGNMSGAGTSVSEKLYIDCAGTTSPLIWGDFSANRVVINGNSSHNPNNRTFYVNGTAGGDYAWYNDSDERLKNEIVTIDNAIEKVNSLRGVYYKWKNPTNGTEGRQVGFIGQEANEILPEVVDSSGDHYSMQYAPITAVLVEAVKEQQSQIESQQKDIRDLQAQISLLQQMVMEMAGQ